MTVSVFPVGTVEKQVGKKGEEGAAVKINSRIKKWKSGDKWAGDSVSE